MRINKDMPGYPGRGAEADSRGRSESHSMRMHGNEAIQRGGGEDPRRAEVAVVIDRKVRDHDMSGYNHRDRPEMSLSDRELMPPKNEEGPRAKEGPMMYADGIMR